jgi:hypothetical protein
VRRLIVCLALAFAACGGSDSGIGLRLSDFPAGWTQYGAGKDESTCASLEAVRKSAAESHRSPVFEKREGLVATSTVFLYDDAAAAREAFKTLSSETTGRCLATSLGARAATRFDVAPAGDERLGLRATAAKTKSHPSGVFDLVFVRAGKGMVELVFAQLVEPFDQRLREALTTKVVGRLNP